MGSGNDDKGKIIKSLLRNTDNGVLLHVRFAPEKELGAVSLRQWLCLRYMLEILRLVPIARTVYRAVPVVVGQNDPLQSVFLCVL